MGVEQFCTCSENVWLLKKWHESSTDCPISTVRIHEITGSILEYTSNVPYVLFITILNSAKFLFYLFHTLMFWCLHFGVDKKHDFNTLHFMYIMENDNKDEFMFQKQIWYSVLLSG